MGAQKTIFLVGAAHMTFEQCKKFTDYRDAEEEAIFVSSCAPGIQIEVCIAQEDDTKGPILAACQFGNLLHVAQTHLFTVETKAELKYRKHIGKQWWKLLETYTKKIAGYHNRLLQNVTEEERHELKVLENIHSTLINHLAGQMSERAFQAVKWKYVDSAFYKNRVPEKPESIQGFEDCTIRKFCAEAYEETGRVALNERWILHESAMGNIEQFFKPTAPRASVRPKSTRAKGFEKTQPGQLQLFA
ncbi:MULTISPECIES: hypothetical protein [Alicyclobacillus]|uniref:Uncharacterized protein n=1 Tax=Alicyclobacillus acidoterrestris (strain ATCC 49025 / DSM 3922 / CIP 106132 / NCIMB 13137 / GD3B) TaxID=1356854 RepID=T0CY60_ALIAG|nr:MULTISPECIES: hypothetical protein [Alicyclobacillus]EPZ44292.1 hypothetical protein N007_11190 [Alicyclobacillus acidoterrestris ATCC 49025]UNO51073.1 hypothetical protein K1I37_21085 [Alicyclobacillus acidoterrestris]GEO27702.1 hypothetical protein AAC03nite_34870 [Alicyclobacillus acidoterrestris]